MFRKVSLASIGDFYECVRASAYVRVRVRVRVRLRVRVEAKERRACGRKGARNSLRLTKNRLL